jgi:hypothetical protein
LYAQLNAAANQGHNSVKKGNNQKETEVVMDHGFTALKPDSSQNPKLAELHSGLH